MRQNPSNRIKQYSFLKVSKKKVDRYPNRVNINRRGGKLVGIEKWLKENPPLTIEQQLDLKEEKEFMAKNPNSSYAKYHKIHMERKKNWFDIPENYIKSNVRKAHMFYILSDFPGYKRCHYECECYIKYMEIVEGGKLILFFYRKPVTKYTL